MQDLSLAVASRGCSPTVVCELHCSGFFLVLRARIPGHPGLVLATSWALEHRLQKLWHTGSIARMWDLPASGIETPCLLHRQA